MKKSNTKIGCPSKIKGFLNRWKHYYYLKNQNKCDEIRYEAETKLSRTSFWRFRKEIIKMFPEEKEWLF